MAKKTSDSQNYQKMLKEAKAIVQDIGSGKMDLDQMVSKIERGYILIKDMRHRLDETKLKIEKLREAHAKEDVDGDDQA